MGISQKYNVRFSYIFPRVRSARFLKPAISACASAASICSAEVNIYLMTWFSCLSKLACVRLNQMSASRDDARKPTPTSTRYSKFWQFVPFIIEHHETSGNDCSNGARLSFVLWPCSNGVVRFVSRTLRFYGPWDCMLSSKLACFSRSLCTLTFSF